jgi:glycosyltransferase involved in cell wall biosynthesis
MTSHDDRRMTGALRILYVATKPPYPPSDGGKLLMWNTLRDLAARGHDITFVAPDLGDMTPEAVEQISKHCRPRLVSCRPRRLLTSLVKAQFSQRPLSILRHCHPALRQTVHQELARGSFDVIHVEQVQSFFNLPSGNSKPPVIFRAQNVESNLWRMVAGVRPKVSWIARREARKMAAVEAQAVRTSAATITLTRRDGEALAGGVGMQAARVRLIPPPFPADLPSADRTLSGDPALFLLGGGWLPNKDSIRWFFGSIWNEVRRENPGVTAHVYGDDPTPPMPSKIRHHSPADSRELFCEGAILVVPLRVASGIRMKILEAWARGIPVVATPEAASGLDARDGDEVLLAGNGAEFAKAIAQLRGEPALRRRLVNLGREILATRHSSDHVAGLLEETYRDAINRART